MQELFERLEYAKKAVRTMLDKDGCSVDMHGLTYWAGEVERLRKEVNLVSIQFQDLQERYEEAQAEIERLEKVLNGRDQLVNALNKCYNQAKSEAVKEFAERLKHSFFDNGYESPDVDFDYFVDNLTKEMVGDK